VERMGHTNNALYFEDLKEGDYFLSSGFFGILYRKDIDYYRNAIHISPEGEMLFVKVPFKSNVLRISIITLTYN
jgi:hypothetical protein